MERGSGKMSCRQERSFLSGVQIRVADKLPGSGSDHYSDKTYLDPNLNLYQSDPDSILRDIQDPHPTWQHSLLHQYGIGGRRGLKFTFEILY